MKNNPPALNHFLATFYPVLMVSEVSYGVGSFDSETMDTYFIRKNKDTLVEFYTFRQLCANF